MSSAGYQKGANMPGLDQTVITQIDPELALGRILTDVRTDFILAPHYSAVFANVGEELWDQVSRALRSGTFEPQLPVTIEVPKPSGLTRPGSILSPEDRLVYQALVDFIAPQAETELDRSRVFSHVLLDPDPEFTMFEPSYECWSRLQQAIVQYCMDEQYTRAIKADVASFFERLYQHNLVNLLRACGCSSEAVNLLERLLSAWMEKDSHGILQGMFPSDFLGNFYLFGLDSDLVVRDLPSARYVDDIYVFHTAPQQARKGLVDLCRMLRHEGLHLNERKTHIFSTEELLREETRLDQLFEQAREEIEAERSAGYVLGWYGFQTIWSPDVEEDRDEEEITLRAVESLYEEADEVDESTADKIEKFCLPILAAAGSDTAIRRTLARLTERHHLAKAYSSYLATFVSSVPDISTEIEHLLENDRLPYDWQLMWVIATLVRAETIATRTVNSVIRIMRDTSRSVALRGLCPLIIGRHGHAGQRRNLRHHYADEPSDYVRASILFSTRYFPSPERRSCVGAWSGHSPTNALIGETVRRLAR
jgi:hypothetical protein